MKEFNNCAEAFASGEKQFKVWTNSKVGSMEFIISNQNCHASMMDVAITEDIIQFGNDLLIEIKKYNLSLSHTKWCDNALNLDKLILFANNLAQQKGVNYQGEKEITDIIED